MVGRNDPCPCGSGKKYKKCCGAKENSVVDLIVNKELDQLLADFFDQYPKPDERPAMMKLLREWLNRLSGSWTKEDIEEAASEFFLFIQQPKGWQAYIKEQIARAKRKSLQAILETWITPFLLLGEVEKAETDVLVVRQLFTEEAYRLVRNEGMPEEEGMLLFGAVLPDPRKGEEVIAPITSMIFLARWSKQTKQSLHQLRDQHASKEPAVFLQDLAIDIYELFIKRSTASLNELVEELLAPSQVAALQAVELALRELEQDGSARELVHKLAVAFFMNEEQEHIAVNDFVAAAVWTGSKKGFMRDIGMSEEEIIFHYEADKENMLSFVRRLTDLCNEMMDGFDDQAAVRAYEIGTDPRPTEKGLWETAMTTSGVVQRKPGVDEGRAQLLAYKAFEAESDEVRKELAQRARLIAPQLPDALLLATEWEPDSRKASGLFEKAIRQASKTFEASENPWRIVPNRPFMRAAFSYGVYLFTIKEFSEAADVFKDLVRMNRMDNQGARYEAVASLIHSGRYREAAEILVRYENGSMGDAVYLYLDWKLELEASDGKSEEAATMLEKATQANGHVRHFMTFRTKPIRYPRKLLVQPGSVEEARYIWLLLQGAAT
ncbi:hypothetical protein HNO89_000245 [Sporosarcina luteola]|nr:hypothetical protein [Sporosarcina luteola]